jgi:hypothetical protein
VEPSAPQGKPLCGRLWRPCPAAGFAVAGSPEGEVKRMANPSSAQPPGQEKQHMQAEDAELERFRRGVNCAALLEGWSPSWRLDRRESTRRALKYRREEGEVLIVNHDGRGWWDPQCTAKGDIFDLVQYLDPKLNFGQVRRELRQFVGVAPTFPPALSGRAKSDPVVPIATRWMTRPRLRRASAVWAYLAGARRLPAKVLRAADDADTLGEGPYGSAWFAHRDDGNTVTHVEIRGPDFKGSLQGRTKSLFRLSRAGKTTLPPGDHRGADRRAERGGDRGHTRGHVLCRDRRRHGTRHGAGDRALARPDGAVAGCAARRRH